MITVVVPVFNGIKITDDFFETICMNTIIPKEIILIDNGSSDNYYGLTKKYKQLNINYVRNEINEGVNSAWNYGIKHSKTPLISILNNDLLLNEYFFQKVLESMNNLKAGIVFPAIIKPNQKFKESLDVPVILKEPRKRNGCAFTIKKEVTDQIEPIPEDLKTYCGDDYLFYQTKLLGYKTFKMSNNFVFHYGGSTLKTVEWIVGKSIRKKEKKIWKKIKE